NSRAPASASACSTPSRSPDRSTAPTATLSPTVTWRRRNSWNIGAIRRCHASMSSSRMSTPFTSTAPPRGRYRPHSSRTSVVFHRDVVVEHAAQPDHREQRRDEDHELSDEEPPVSGRHPGPYQAGHHGRGGQHHVQHHLGRGALGPLAP